MKTTRTIEEFTCDGCGKKIDAEEASQEIAWTSGFNHDCLNYERVIVQDYVSYGHPFEDSNLCWECKKKILKKALEIVNEKIEGSK